MSGDNDFTNVNVLEKAGTQEKDGYDVRRRVKEGVPRDGWALHRQQNHLETCVEERKAEIHKARAELLELDEWLEEMKGIYLDEQQRRCEELSALVSSLQALREELQELKK